MSNTIYLTFVLVLSIQGAYSLTCYTCNSLTSNSCTQSANHQTVVCGQPITGYKALCSYIETYDPYRRTYNVEAGCQLANYHDSINTVKAKLCSPPSHLNLNKCILCEHNYCNSVYY